MLLMSLHLPHAQRADCIQVWETTIAEFDVHFSGLPGRANRLLNANRPLNANRLLSAWSTEDEPCVIYNVIGF